MHRLASTVVCVVGAPGTGEATGRLLDAVGAAANVTVVRPDESLPGPERAAAAWRACQAAPTPYVVHDADPLSDVADAWVARYDGSGPAGGLEVAVAAALDALRRERVDLPDSFVVLDPESWPVTRRHWYLGVLAGAAPARVVPSPPSARGLLDVLAALPAGRWWPEPPERLLDGIDRVVPDRVAVPGLS